MKKRNEDLRQEIADRDGWSCCWCNKELLPKTATLEHLLARSRGGSNSPSNLRLSCAPCNNGRGDGAPRKKKAPRSVSPPPSPPRPPKRRPQQDACYCCGARCEDSLLCPTCSGGI